MVAVAGRYWKLAPSLVAAVREANRIAPRRSKATDGSLGDRAHSHRVSDHNPANGYVHALDLTHDPRGGFDAHAHGDAIKARMDPRVKYLISRGRIWTPSVSPHWRRYTGSNPHNSHLHISVHGTQNGRFNTAPWFSAVPLFPTLPGDLPEKPEDNKTPMRDEDDEMTICYRVGKTGNEFWVVDGVFRYPTTKYVYDVHVYASAAEGRARHKVVGRDEFNDFIVAMTQRADHMYLAYHNTNQIAKATNVPRQDIR